MKEIEELREKVNKLGVKLNKTNKVLKEILNILSYTDSGIQYRRVNELIDKMDNEKKN